MWGASLLSLSRDGVFLRLRSGIGVFCSPPDLPPITNGDALLAGLDPAGLLPHGQGAAYRVQVRPAHIGNVFATQWKVNRSALIGVLSGLPRETK